MICVDLVGPMVKSTQGYQYILTVVDYFSKFPLLFPLRTATAKGVCKILEDQVFLLFGVPRSVVCDNGPQFRSRELRGSAVRMVPKSGTPPTITRRLIRPKG